MEANLNALGIILAPLLAIIISFIWGTKPNKDRIVSAIVGPSAICLLLLILYPRVSSARDFPIYQVLIPIISLFPIMLFIKRNVVSFLAALLMFVLAVGLVIHYFHITNGMEYSERNPERNAAHIQRAFGITKSSVSKKLVAYSAHDSNSYPEGWLFQSPLGTVILESMTNNITDQTMWLFENFYTYYLWHSSLTHIYGRDNTPIDLWYPGGKLTAENINNISLKKKHKKKIFDNPFVNCLPQIRALNNLKLMAVYMMLYSREHGLRDTNSYPAGWLSESPMILSLPQSQQQNLKDHNAFTFDFDGKHQEVWYSGGKISDANISVRDR